MPSIRYLSHVRGRGINVIGAGEAAAPGHNGQVAFGLTVFPADQEDLMVYELQRGKYQYQGAWTEFTSEKEVILVADTPPVHRLLYFSVHGPALYQDDRAGRAFGLRSVLSEPGSAPYLAALGYLGATNVRDFAKSLERWDSPGENHLFADVAENIGLRPAAMIPARTDHDGLMPVPGGGVLSGMAPTSRACCRQRSTRTRAGSFLRMPSPGRRNFRLPKSRSISSGPARGASCASRRFLRARNNTPSSIRWRCSKTSCPSPPGACLAAWTWRTYPWLPTRCLWQQGEAVPLLFSRAAILANTQTRIDLVPAAQSNSTPGGQ